MPHIKVEGDGRLDPGQGLHFAPAYYLLLVSRLGTRRERIVERLEDLGVPTPPSALPRQHEVDWGPRVWFDRVDVPFVINHLRARIPPGTRWGFNYEGHRAWAIAESSVDLDALVSAAKPT